MTGVGAGAGAGRLPLSLPIPLLALFSAERGATGRTLGGRNVTCGAGGVKSADKVNGRRTMNIALTLRRLQKLYSTSIAHKSLKKKLNALRRATHSRDPPISKPYSYDIKARGKRGKNKSTPSLGWARRRICPDIHGISLGPTEFAGRVAEFSREGGRTGALQSDTGGAALSASFAAASSSLSRIFFITKQWTGKKEHVRVRYQSKRARRE